MSRTLRGYAILPGFVCPSCAGQVAMIEDDGTPDRVLVRCWCGGHGHCPANDPDIVLALGLPAEPR